MFATLLKSNIHYEVKYENLEIQKEKNKKIQKYKNIKS